MYMANRIGVALRVVAGAMALAPALGAQSLVVPASDPVGIARAGGGLAYGRSLESASLNPALLTTLQDPRSAFLSLGEEFQSAQVSLESNQKTLYSTDRNRFVPTFGLAWRWSDRTVLGLKLDTPYLRHGRFDASTSTRFLGDEIDLASLRLMAQGARSFGDKGQFSLGLEAGLVRISFAEGTTVRARVPLDPTQPASGSNPSQGLVETRVREEGNATLFAAGMGFRWAINTRWTLGFAANGVLKGRVNLDASYGSEAPTYTANDGFGPAPLGIGALGSSLLQASTPVAGRDRIALPGQAALALRHRVNNLFTWEGTVRYTRWNDMRIPTLPGLATPSGLVRNAPVYASQNAIGLGLDGELALSRDWTVRGGFSLDQGARRETDVDHLMGGGRLATFGAGASWKTFGGELSAGYQVRISQDRDSTRLEGTWSATGYRPIGTATRVENMGHLFSIGFKKAF